jgi:predicted CXXCH cytochrome family protein
MVGHPVSGPNVNLGNDVPPITCLTCHDAHHSSVANLIPPKYKNATGLCLYCHRGTLS